MEFQTLRTALVACFLTAVLLGFWFYSNELTLSRHVKVPSDPVMDLKLSEFVQSARNTSEQIQDRAAVPARYQEYLTAQFGQDKYMYETYFHKLKEPGFFVEFGGRDGIDHSNTYLFENRLGWKGLIAEAVEVEFNKLATNRPNSIAVKTAVCDHAGTTEFLVSKIEGWHGAVGTYKEDRKSKTSRVVTVPCITLERLLADNKIHNVNYMTVDTEGSEYDILKVFPAEKFQVDYIQVEMFTGNSTASVRMIEMMMSKKYKLVHIFQVDPGTDDLLFERIGVQAPLP